MNNYDLLVIAIAAVSLFFVLRSWWLAARLKRTGGFSIFNKKKPTERKPYIKEGLVKVMFNPFNEKWMWTKLNPKTHVWEWNRIATESEVLAYENITLSEEIGDKILSMGEQNNG